MDLQELRDRIYLWKQGRLAAEPQAGGGDFDIITDDEGEVGYDSAHSVTPSQVVVAEASVPAQEAWAADASPAPDRYEQQVQPEGHEAFDQYAAADMEQQYAEQAAYADQFGAQEETPRPDAFAEHHATTDASTDEYIALEPDPDPYGAEAQAVPGYDDQYGAEEQVTPEVYGDEYAAADQAEPPEGYADQYVTPEQIAQQEAHAQQIVLQQTPRQPFNQTVQGYAQIDQATLDGASENDDPPDEES